jgi:hypothetical protein
VLDLKSSSSRLGLSENQGVRQLADNCFQKGRIAEFGLFGQALIRTISVLGSSYKWVLEFLKTLIVPVVFKVLIYNCMANCECLAK